MSLLVAKLMVLAERAKAEGQIIRVTDVHHTVAGIPDEINEEYISFPAGSFVGARWQMEQGEYNPAKGEQIITMQSLCSIDIVAKIEPNGDKK